MNVKVIAPFALKRARGGETIELPEGATSMQLLRLLHAPIYAYALPMTVNGEQVGKHKRLHEGDLVVFLVPFSGG